MNTNDSICDLKVNKNLTQQSMTVNCNKLNYMVQKNVTWINIILSCITFFASNQYSRDCNKKGKFDHLARNRPINVQQTVRHNYNNRIRTLESGEEKF